MVFVHLSTGTDMALPPLYKYLDVNGAKRTLGDRTFRHAKPSSYDDSKDMTIKSVFPEEVETALTTLSEGWVGILLANVDETPTCNPKLAATVKALQDILRRDPEQAERLKNQFKELFDVEQMRARSEAFVKETNDFLQTYRVFCVTTDKASERMWEDYAEDHQGIVLRIVPNTEKASKFELFRPVEYRESRPALFDHTLDFLEGYLFGDQAARTRAILDKIIYTKTLPYTFEKEYRLAIPVGEDGDWDKLSYHPEEVTEIYLGLAMNDDDKSDIIKKAKALNPNIAIFRANRDAKKKLAFKAG
jgi:hypothetical protein